MNTYPFYLERQCINLDGSWQFRFLEKTWLEDADENHFEPNDRMCVPGAFDAMPDYRCKRGTALYRREFIVTQDAQRGLLKLGAIGLRARICIDGRQIGFSEMPYTEMEIETGALNAGRHVVTAAVDNNFDMQNTPFDEKRRMKLFLPYYDFYAFGGFYRSVSLQLLPATPVFDRVQVHTLDITTGKVALRVLFLNDTADARHQVRYRFDTEEQWHDAEVAHGESIECTVPDFKLWTPSTPNLHTVEVRMDGDSIVERFGIRTIAAGKKQILLNGAPIYLKGFNRHESHPDYGPVTPDAQLVTDLQHLRDLHCNFVRGCHYTQDQRFLDLCDEFGIMIWDESLGWGNYPEQMGNDEYQTLVERQTRIMVRESINHPCVIIWAFLNEMQSQSDEGCHLGRRLLNAIKDEDSSRLVTFACNHVDDDNTAKYMDIISYNIYPGWIGEHAVGIEPPEEILPCQQKVIARFRSEASADKPMIVSEMGCCGFYGEHDRACTQWSEEFQAEYFDAVLNAVEAAKDDLCGVTLWQFCDAMTYHRMGADIRCKPLGLNLAGVFDKYRRPKLAANVVKQHFAEI